MNDTYDIYHFDELDRGFNSPDGDGIYPPSAEFILKMNKPYSYEPFYVFICSNEKVTGSVYSDRLQSWDSDGFHKAAQKVFGTDYPNYKKDAKLVEKFMQAYNDEPNLVLCKVIEYCNASNGYPCWRIDYHVPK